MFWLYKATLTSWHFASPFLSRDTSVVDAHVVLRICWCTGTDSGLRANDLRKIHHMPCLISGCQWQPQPPCQRQQPQMHFVGGCFKMESKHEFTTKALRLTWVQDEHFGFPEGREVMLRQSPAKVTTIRNLQTSLRQTVLSKFPLDLPKGSIWLCQVRPGNIGIIETTGLRNKQSNELKSSCCGWNCKRIRKTSA